MPEMTHSQTYTGKRFNHERPLDNEFDIVDIAHHLALTNRYGGAALWPYSVAQHSVHVAEWLWMDTGCPYTALDGLMHDAAEAYCGDMRGPLKVLLPDYKAHEAAVDEALRHYFAPKGLLLQQTKECKIADRRICLDERAIVMHPVDWDWGFGDLQPLGIDISYRNWVQAEDMFMSTWERLVDVIARRETGTQLANDLAVRA